ncbi:hypothetical protein [uncultured Eubacterium sp.]|uniref:hypothetical protein n=1 Tax=uncultured Eubacterium sp. TaxID=165185 RepID=UPI002672D9ED|nr:hypothetical protein [uncultured Eubacterium sp.]
MKIKNFLIFLICILIYCIPLGAVIVISNREIKKYDEDTDFYMSITAYGGIEKVIKMDMKESYLVDMKVTSIEEYTIVCSNEAVIECEVGDEIHKNQILGNDKGNIIKSNFNGSISNINYSEDNTIIKYNDFSNLVYEAYVDEDKFEDFDTKKFYNNKGKKIKILEKSNIIEEGKFKVWMTIPDKKAIYGKTVEKYELYTDTVYSNALVVTRDCVYSVDDKHYIRTVDENGLFLEDVEVNVGFANDKFICITGDGIKEGVYCDSGYSKVEEEISEEN